MGQMVCPATTTTTTTIIIIIIIILESAVQGRERVRTLHQSKDPNPTQPTHPWKEEKYKTVGDIK